MRTEWVIHIWGKEREQLEFTQQEKFHIDMIKSYDHSIFDKVLINIAMYDINDEELFNLFKKELLKVFFDIKEVEIKKCQNDKILSEYVTFRPYVWDRIGDDVRIFYSHFKGYASNVRIINSGSYPERNIIINEYYWSYLMYRMSLDKEYITEMKDSFDSGKDVYCWCLLDKHNLEQLCVPENENYYNSYFRNIESIDSNIKELYIKENDGIHNIGSFVWYDMKNIYNHIGNIFDIISLDNDMLKNACCTSHFCELYIWKFLNIKNIQEQTIINNVRKQFISIKNNTYSQIYCSKKICNEYIKDFNKYIIQNKII